MSRPTTTTFGTAVAAAGIALALAACGGSPAPSTPAAPASSSAAATSSSSSSTAPSSTSSAAPSTSSSAASAAPVVITIKDFEFMVPASVKAGASIMLTNSDNENHTVTSKDGGFDVKVAGHGGTAMLTAPSKPGSYSLTCDFHGTMKGTLVVS